jgi:hypothetical protein
VRWDILAGLMAPCANQAGRTKLGTRPRRVVTSAFMATIPVNSQGIMKASAPERSPILPFLQTLLLLGSFMLSHLWPPATTLPLVFLHSPTQNPYAMPRERGKSRRGSLYYNALSRRNRLDPSQLALITTSTPDPSQNWLEPPQQPLPPPSNPTMDFAVALSKRKLPLLRSILLVEFPS